jgi:site-specific DNA-methyltransferase (adenine-specific)
MSNRSHFNSGHIAMNILNKNGIKHSSNVVFSIPKKTYHGVFVEDAVKFLEKLPDSSIQLILIDPPYNLDLANWDTFSNYMNWARPWLKQAERVLKDNGNLIIFGGYQYQDIKKGDLLEIMHYLRHNTSLLFVNLVIWYYNTGMSAHRFFANRHEEILWYAKTKKYYFDLDSVRIKFDEKTKEEYKKDKRLNPLSIEKGKNPTNVWKIERLSANSLERVGHPAQKPLEIVRRLVKGLSYPGSTVLDFFAGSGTTGVACIEEKRNSILVDNDPKFLSYFEKHLSRIGRNKTNVDYEILHNVEISELLNKMSENTSKNDSIGLVDELKE